VTSERGYLIDEILGTGSTSTVVRARPQGESRPIVVKVLQPELLDHREILGRTRDEAKLLALLAHPNIVAVEAFVVHHGRPLVVMEYVDGADLGLVLRMTGAVPVPEAVEIAKIAARTLHAANTAPGEDGHVLDVVHRDIKPSNLLLAHDGTVKLVDFGLARAQFSERETHTDAFVLGSMGFVAPERYEAMEPTPAVDVYALGVTLLQLLTARLLVVPRGARHDEELFRQLNQMKLSGLTEEARAELVELIGKMCRQNPAMRVSSDSVASELGAWLGRHGLVPDLPSFAAGRIDAVRKKRPQGSVREHPAWAELAFLEQPEGLGGRALQRVLAWFGWKKSY
jgi:serine/threonine-protein kinase